MGKLTRKGQHRKNCLLAFLENCLNDPTMNQLIRWINESQGLFQVLWVHGGRSSYQRMTHGCLFDLYRQYRGRGHTSDPKQAFRMALKKSPCVQLVEGQSNEDWRSFRIIYKCHRDNSVADGTGDTRTPRLSSSLSSSCSNEQKQLIKEENLSSVNKKENGDLFMYLPNDISEDCKASSQTGSFYPMTGNTEFSKPQTWTEKLYEVGCSPVEPNPSYRDDDLMSTTFIASNNCYENNLCDYSTNNIGDLTAWHSQNLKNNCNTNSVYDLLQSYRNINIKEKKQYPVTSHCNAGSVMLDTANEKCISNQPLNFNETRYRETSFDSHCPESRTEFQLNSDHLNFTPNGISRLLSDDDISPGSSYNCDPFFDENNSDAREAFQALEKLLKFSLTNNDCI